MMVLLVAVIAAGGCGEKKDSEQAKTGSFPDEVVETETIVWVNEVPIKGNELRTFTLLYRAGTVDSLKNRAFNLRMLEGLVDRTLMWQEANALGLAVDDSTSQWYIGEFIKSIGGTEALTELTGSLGISRYDLEQTIKKDLTVRRFLEVNIAQGILVNDSTARAYYDLNPDEFTTMDSVRARHIILRGSPGDAESVKQEKYYVLNDLRARISAGEDFADLAKEYSEGPTGPRGGDLGYFSRRDMVGPFTEAAFALKPGEVSGIVETQFGYHLIKVEDKIPARKLTFEDVKPDLIRQIQGFLLQQELQNHLQGSREVATIRRNY